MAGKSTLPDAAQGLGQLAADRVAYAAWTGQLPAPEVPTEQVPVMPQYPHSFCASMQDAQLKNVLHVQVVVNTASTIPLTAGQVEMGIGLDAVLLTIPRQVPDPPQYPQPG